MLTLLRLPCVLFLSVLLRLSHAYDGSDVRPDFNWSAGWAIAKAITGLTNTRSQPLKKRWRARNDVAL